MDSRISQTIENVSKIISKDLSSLLEDEGSNPSLPTNLIKT